MIRPSFREMAARRLSILIGTRNRRALLAEALESFKRCRVPSGCSVELIVVDNGSTDGTSQVAASFDGKLPFPLRVIVEPRPGLGSAHAAGLACASGEIIALTDDDCLVSENWCEAIVEAFSQEPQLGGLFGRVLAHQDGKDSVWRVAVKTKEERTLHRFPCWPIIGFGNNMAFRRVALESVGAFNPLFGPGGPFWSSEELELTYRVLRAGWLISYEPSAQLWHRARTEFENWKHTHQRDALGIGAFTGSYGIRGDGFAWKFAWWNWWGMFTSWVQGVLGGQTQKRQVGGWYAWHLPLGFLAGALYGFRKNPAPASSTVLAVQRSAIKTPDPCVISIILCTRNRAPLLKEALESILGNKTVEMSRCELIIVDNGSQDETHAVVTAAQQNSPLPIVYVYEPRKGVARAKNVGLQLARGELFAFTDDDCVVADDWIGTITQTFERNKDISGFCGRVLPHGGEVTSAVVSVKTDERSRRFVYPCSPFIGHGNNMAFRSEALMRTGDFDIMLGPGGPMRSGEEMDMFYRLLRQGEVLGYEPASVVYHRSRLSNKEADAVEWRNAVGLGACLSKHMLRGDWFAVKCAYWLVAEELPAAAEQAIKQGALSPIKKRLLFCLGFPCGMLRWCAFLLSGGPKRAQCP